MIKSLNKDQKIVLAIIFGFAIINIISYIKFIPNLETQNTFAFWNYTLHSRTGEFVLMLSPILVSLIASNYLYEKINGAMFKNEVIRIGYNRSIIKNYFELIKKTFTPFLILKIFIFIIAFIILPHKIVETNFYEPMQNFEYIGLSSPYLYVLLNLVSLLFYIITITNIVLIAFKFMRRIIPTTIMTFILSNACNFLIYILALGIAKLINTNAAITYATNTNFYEGYIVQSTAVHSVINSFIFMIITFLIMYGLYHSKKWLETE